MSAPSCRWGLAWALSVVAHVLVLSGAGPLLWHDASQPAEPVTRLEAHLVVPQKIVPRALAPKPAPPAPSASEEPIPQRHILPEAPLEAPAESQPGPQPVAPLAHDYGLTPPAASEPLFPQAVRLSFSVRMGVGGVLVGRMQQTWRSDGARYRIESHTTSAGLVALFKTMKFDQLSEGTLDAQGLRPAYFRSDRDGVLNEEVRFEWDKARLTLRNRDEQKETALPEGVQDVLSLFYQTALRYRGDETITVQVATGKRCAPYLLARVGEERLDTALGSLSATHLKRVSSPGEDEIEIWLGRELSWLPVRIRFTDRKGQVFDQLLDEADIDGVRPVLPRINGGPALLEPPLSG